MITERMLRKASQLVSIKGLISHLAAMEMHYTLPTKYSFRFKQLNRETHQYIR